jgi:putative endonuclease
MSHWVYILYGRSIDKYYVGESENVIVRLDQHNEHVFEDAFTRQAKDWTLMTQLCCSDRTQARAVEDTSRNRSGEASLSG